MPHAPSEVANQAFLPSLRLLPRVVGETAHRIPHDEPPGGAPAGNRTDYFRATTKKCWLVATIAGSVQVARWNFHQLFHASGSVRARRLTARM